MSFYELSGPVPIFQVRKLRLGEVKSQNHLGLSDRLGFELTLTSSRAWVLNHHAVLPLYTSALAKRLRDRPHEKWIPRKIRA